ncbi:MAG: M61 family metallopeptidase, partial [Granulosicoccus sp.]|nr:M61 family metallopeptidase [Granulosicoccus sp.]
LSVQGQENELHQLRLLRPAHDNEAVFRVATTLQAEDTDPAGFGLYQAADYDDLIDHPVELGDFRQLTFAACGVTHDIVFTGDCHFDEQRVIDDLQRICEYQIRFFGEPPPMPRYLFMVMVVDTGYGGLEHRSSTALMITRENLPVTGSEAISEPYLNFLGLCSHEYFHTWNVKRIKPARFVPYRLEAESPTELLWFFEGMTSYYDDLVLVRAGLIDEERYFGLLANTLTRVRRGPGRLVQTVTDSSLDAWHKFYKKDENSPNAIVSYYAKGALIAVCLDALMRQSSNGKVTLDDLMRALWAQWLEDGMGIDERAPQELACRLAGADLSEFFDLALYSTRELPVDTALSSLGVQLNWRARTSATDMGGAASAVSKDKVTNDLSDSPWLGASVDDAPGGVRITQVLSASPAERAGLAAGDLLVALNRLSVSKTDIDNHLQRFADLEQLPIHFFRLGQLHESNLPLERAPDDTAELAVADADRLGEWLHDERLKA